MKPIEQLKEHMRSSFREQKSKLSEGQELFFGASSTFGYVDIPIEFMAEYPPKTMYQALFYKSGNNVRVSEGVSCPYLVTFKCRLGFKKLLDLALQIRDEVQNEVS